MIISVLKYLKVNEYINNKKNGFIKEYNSNSFIKFDERIGKGKEYSYSGKLEFECKYLNSERNGKGKELDYSDNIEFEGEYLNDKRNGKGKEYYSNGNIKFEGEYSNFKRNRKGKRYYIKDKN